MNFIIRFGSIRAVSTLLLTAFLGLPSLAHAAGFVCIDVDQDTRIDVYLSSLDPQGPAPVATKLVLLDPSRSAKRQNIATFDVNDGLLQTSGSQVRAVVDLTKPGTSRGGERVGGTRLNQLEALVLNIDVSYEEPINEGARYSAEVTYVKKNGQELHQDFDCNLFPGTTPDKVQVVP